MIPGDRPIEAHWGHRVVVATVGSETHVWSADEATDLWAQLGRLLGHAVTPGPDVRAVVPLAESPAASSDWHSRGSGLAPPQPPREPAVGHQPVVLAR